MPPAKTARTQAAEYVQVTEAFTGTLDDAPVVVSTAEIFQRDHPLVRAYPTFFKALEPTRQRPAVEQMTAIPGERRGQSPETLRDPSRRM